jgi:predicted nucleic-acid-binding Zn-ribbon protein
MVKKCSICENENLEPGSIQSTGKIFFRLENTKFLSFKTANIELKANLCMACGHVELMADTQKASALLSKAKPQN